MANRDDIDTNDNPLSDIFGGSSTKIQQPGISQEDDGDFDIIFDDNDEADAGDDDTNAPQARRGQNEDPDGTDDGYQAPGLDHVEIDRERASWRQREEQMARTVAETEKRRIATERESARVAIDSLDIRIATATQAIKAAKIEQDVGAEVDFTNQLRELHKVRDEIIGMRDKLPSDADIDRQLEDWKAKNLQPLTPSRGGADVQPGNELASKFMQQNPWMRDARHAAARDYLLQVDKQLAAEGYDPKSPAHFAELSRRVASRHPSVSVKMLDGRAVGTGAQPLASSRPQSPPVASARGSGAPSNRSGKPQVRVSETDKQMLRKMGLDPSNKAVQQRFAREKILRTRMERT